MESKTAACKISVPGSFAPNTLIVKNVKLAGCIYNCNVNPASIEALLARKSKSCYEQGNVNPVVYSCIFSCKCKCCLWH